MTIDQQEQRRILDNCDFNIKMFRRLAMNCAPSHVERLKARAIEQEQIKAELVSYFSGAADRKSLSWQALEKLMVMPEWATKGT